MGRYFACALGIGCALAINVAPAAAQTHVDIGVFLPNVGARVVVGRPRVYVPPPVYAPRVVVVERDYRHDRGRHRGWDKRDRGRFDRDSYYSSRDPRYRRDVVEAEREYARSVRDARRDYYDDIRDARRDGRRRW